MSEPNERQAELKRSRADQESGSSVAADRLIRQRLESSASVAAVGSVPAASAVSNADSSSPGAVTPPRLSFMRLAVVERQLIMQGLDLTSLARLASTCSQLRAEALHREAGKFIPEPEKGSEADGARSINDFPFAHDSPLFRAHMPVTLVLKQSLTSNGFQTLLAKAATFSRITQLMINSQDPVIWTEARMLQLLAQPWIQRVERVCPNQSFEDACVWLQSPAVQRALFALPSLTSMDLSIGPGERLLKSAVVQARKLTSMVVEVSPERARSIRALSVAPSLGRLELAVSDDPDPWAQEPPTFRELIWCLPPALHTLSLYAFNLSDPAPRSALKAFFGRTPLLRELHVDWMNHAKLLQGMLDAGVNALPELRRVELIDFSPADLPQPLIRRFLHRFAKVSMRLEPSEPQDAEMHLENYAFQDSFVGWPRVEVTLTQNLNRRPPSPHASDDESGSDVEHVSDPGSDLED